MSTWKTSFSIYKKGDIKMAVTKDVKKNAVKKDSKSISKEETIIRYGFLTLAVIVGLCIVYFVVASLIPKYYIKVGNDKIPEAEFMYQTNMQYNVFVNYYQDYIQALNFDLSTKEGVISFMTTGYDNEKSFGQMLLESVVDSIQQTYVLLGEIEKTGFAVDEQELEESYKIQIENVQKAADEEGYDLDTYAGIHFGTTEKAMKTVIRRTLKAEQYTKHLEEENLKAITDERALLYYESVDKDGGLIRDDIDKVTVATILKRTVDDQLKPLADDVIAAAKATAEQVYALALEGKDIYELSALYNDSLEEPEEDSVPSTKPGEYTFSKREIQITVLSDWAFDAKIGDIGLLETDIGYIVTKLMSRTEYEDIKGDVFRIIANSDYQMNMKEFQQKPEYAVGLYRPYQDTYLSYTTTR